MAKILLIDDDPDMRQLISAALNKEGFSVTTVSRKQEALQKIIEDKPSVVLLDVLLSGDDGRDLCREIKANAATQHIPVIMLSGHPAAAVKIESCGADDFLAKPFSTQELLSRLHRRMDIRE
ncbi:MAG TPA: response regulator transcription factor [Flavisolibacter sp.]|jgi:DNA-binding response OmpR family regulator|nr:response regulator transcription factor [Flavisolibacter sp.]